jgi:hypothetical protein
MFNHVTFDPEGMEYSLTPNPRGFGKYGLRMARRWKMLVLLTFPAIGIWVSNGVFGIYDTPGNGARLVCAIYGASPVCVGPD